jgi:4-amino-4-deoxychorismate lyase
LESPLYETAGSDLKVIETLRFAGQDGFVRLDLHVERAARTCARLRFPFDGRAMRAALHTAVGDEPARCRVTIDRSGEVTVETAPLAPAKGLWRVSVAAEILTSNDPWLALKTTRRDIYDRARAAMPEGADEVIFLNEHGALCEGSITNIFVPRGDVLLTPAQACGLLPGVLRQELLESGRAQEAFLTLDDLRSEQGFFVGNSLRGLIPAKLL